MPTGTPQKCTGLCPAEPGAERRSSRGAVGTSARRRLTTAVALLLALGAAAFAVAPHRTLDTRDIPARGSVEDGGLRYEFDALTGREALLDISFGPDQVRDVLADRPDDVERMRVKLARKLGVRSLDDMVDAHRAAADQLRRLGYL